MKYNKLWASLAAVIIFSFAVLLYYGREIYQEAPPIPTNVTTDTGQTLFTHDDIQEGKEIWQSIGGQELGSVWGHGAYIAPDWTADWLHKEAVFLLNHWAKRDFQKPYDEIPTEQQALLQSRLTTQLKNNRVDDQNNLVISTERALAIEAVTQHYVSLFGDDKELHDLREAYAMPKNTIKDPEKIKKMSTFFFWSSWASVTNRPNDTITYTNNWPPEKLVGNAPSSSLIIWTGFSVILLLLGIGVLTYYYSLKKKRTKYSRG